VAGGSNDMNVTVCMAAMRGKTVGAAVRSIVKQTYREWELVVVVQGPSSAEIAETVRRELGRREGRVIMQPGRGVCRARNAAIEAAQGELVAMTDDDCEAQPDWLEVLVDRFRGTPSVGLVGGALVAPPRSRRGPATIPACSPAETLYEPAVSGHTAPAGFVWLAANFAVTPAAAQAIGPFDELMGAGTRRFPVAADGDFNYRAAERKISMISTPDAIVHHTYGWRYGVRALWSHQRQYSRGHGGFAGKLTLLGDPAGAAMMRDVRRTAITEWWERRSPVLLPIAIRRYYYHLAAYRECLRDFQVDTDGLLQEKASAR
jgi:glycosyltransferase involved in cell wall biosynthesis